MPIYMRRIDGDESEFAKKKTEDTSKIEFYLTGTFDRPTAEAYALTNTPLADGHRKLQGIKLKEIPDARDGAWQVAATYKANTILTPPVVEPPLTIVEKAVGFAVGGGSRFVSHSLATIQSYNAPGETAPAFGNQLNMIDGVPEGLEVTPGSMAESSFTVEQIVPTGLISNAWLEAIEEATFCTNDAIFRGRQIGEVLFHGLRGTYETQAATSNLSWEFLVIKNKPAHTVGVFTNVVKKGWEYAWIYSEEREKTSGEGATYKANIIRQPVGLYVEKLFTSINMGDIGVTA